jgi:probable rRNA maturation factor
VLAFPIDDPVEAAATDADTSTPGPGPLLLGDVVVCPAVAERQAPEHATTYDDELALLVVHGVLHVLGHDHADVGETALMRAREREMLQRFHERR